MAGQSPFIFGDAHQSARLTRGVKEGRLRQLRRGLFTTDVKTDPARLVADHFTELTAHYFPHAVIADRSVPDARPDPDGNLFVVHPRTRPMVLPGLRIIPRKGSPALPDDLPFPHGLFLSSRPRALLENLRPSRSVKGRPRRTLTERELHDWIARLLRSEGRERLNLFRDRARELSVELHLEEAFARLDDLIGAALGTREVETASTSLAAAQRGLPYDERRDAAFERLHQHLDARAPSARPLYPEDRARRALLPFFEAYFSNFIEGTEFTPEEARAIVLDGVIPRARPEDAHDVLGTYQVVSDDREMRRRATTLDEFFELLKSRHARVMEGRPEKQPGAFKTRANRAGSTEFVVPDLVEGTLARGFAWLQRLTDPFARAVMMMFVVSEVHPFADGNGRVARIMMNAELHAADEQRIIIPTVFRNEYLASLKAMTHNQNPGPLTRVLDFAQRFTHEVDFSTWERARAQLEEAHAFMDSTEAANRGLRLTLPSASGA